MSYHLPMSSLSTVYKPIGLRYCQVQMRRSSSNYVTAVVHDYLYHYSGTWSLLRLWLL